MNQLVILGGVALGGAFGACSRYFLNELMLSTFGRDFPYGTLTVNVIGSLLMGITLALVEQELIAEPWRLVFSVGFLGALTTFSTFSADNFLLIQEGDWLKLAANVLLNVILGIAALALGFQFFAKN